MIIKENLYDKRIISIDAFRGITIFIMIFVNELSTVTNIPYWLKHMPADADGLTFVDVVFPAFLFIVGMSIPFAFNSRLRKGDSSIHIWKHTLKRSFALIIMGLYMVNAEYGYDSFKMIISASIWGLLAYSIPILVWNKYEDKISKNWKYVLIYAGIIGYVALYFLYIQEETGNRGMTQKWWGILGLIGWAYLFTVIWYWITNGNLIGLIVFLFLSILINSLSRTEYFAISGFKWFNFINSHLINISIVTGGVIISLLFFENKSKPNISWKVILFGILFFAMGYILRPYFEISKIKGTPSWALYSMAICTGIYYILYWIMEIKNRTNWSKFIMPAASNPLLIYILPGIIIYFFETIGIKIIPDFFNTGVMGIIWSLFFSVIMLFIVRIFNYYHIRLNL